MFILLACGCVPSLRSGKVDSYIAVNNAAISDLRSKEITILINQEDLSDASKVNLADRIQAILQRKGLRATFYSASQKPQDHSNDTASFEFSRLCKQIKTKGVSYNLSQKHKSGPQKDKHKEAIQKAAGTWNNPVWTNFSPHEDPIRYVPVYTYTLTVSINSHQDHLEKSVIWRDVLNIELSSKSDEQAIHLLLSKFDKDLKSLTSS
ncbi:MAG: hypothetical protein K0S74_1832 [Chlamydiales bacterium]|nr:hypothetical protein [Chlamydiales bacterium]